MSNAIPADDASEPHQGPPTSQPGTPEQESAVILSPRITVTLLFIGGLIALLISGLVWANVSADSQVMLIAEGAEPDTHDAGTYVAAALFAVAGTVMTSISVIAMGVSLGGHIAWTDNDNK